MVRVKDFLMIVLSEPKASESPVPLNITFFLIILLLNDMRYRNQIFHTFRYTTKDGLEKIKSKIGHTTKK